ncbi:hypothetical protein SCUCBS95973_005774 [Sporothrix curviconia]|uniref:Lipid droplet-associated hydrolase n=1 Tax=Sporothrix curviconia TaxID=1260050 RepID=A0ABP0C0N0_9PEZI
MPVWLSFPSRPSTSGASIRVPAPPPPTARTKHILVYFVPGNPGFIDYYAPFLATLRMLLDEAEDGARKASSNGRDVRFHLLGRNLLGFEDGDDGGGAYGPAPYDLITQIRGVMDAVAAARIDLGKADDDDAGGGWQPRHGEAFDQVVLMGHSVGSYIALDVFRRQLVSQREQRAQRALAGANKGQRHPAPGQLSIKEPLGGTDHLRLRRGILLFATLAHLAKSQRGQKLERVLLTTPVVSGWADVLVQAVVWWLLPVWAMALVVQYVLGFPPHAAAVTLRFLSSRGGVRQALYLGRDELLRIGPDEWEDELWETVDGGEEEEDDDDKKPNFVILFGENDHWVADDVRDEFIARRKAHKKNRAAIVIDERGWPHDFCIRHGEEVAETVKLWIADLAETA